MSGFYLRPLTIFVLVDEYVKHEMGGRVYSLYYDSYKDFFGAKQLLQMLDTFHDQASFPQRTHDYRTFDKSKTTKIAEKGPTNMDLTKNPGTGQKATFLINVEFRQNATFQGTIKWLEENKECRFRSDLEMLKLMDEAIPKSPDDQEELKW
ncbi:MAG: hypothetical protein FWD39_01800 [Clostridiales bacterium]|nr:hypothetical protein [Clostridiales bacterium]